MNNNCGIYKIINIVNNKMYIGSSVNLKSRKYAHFNGLRKNNHANDYLQKSFNKHGEDKFKWEIIEYVKRTSNLEATQKRLLKREQYWMDTLETYNREIGYNLCKTAKNSITHKISEDTRNKIRERMKGINPLGHLSNESKKEVFKKVSETKKGHKVSKETREKISESLKNNKDRIIRRGYTHSKETREKISESNKGREVWNKGKKLSKEHIEKLKVSNKPTKKVLNIDTNKKFDSIAEASKYYNVSANGIAMVCRGIRNKAGNYKWKFI